MIMHVFYLVYRAWRRTRLERFMRACGATTPAQEAEREKRIKQAFDHICLENARKWSKEAQQ